MVMRMQGRFTERAIQALKFAQYEAQQFGHDYIGTEHLLLGLVKEGGGVAARALQSLGLELDKVRARVGELVGPGEGVQEQFYYTPRAKRVMELAFAEAQQLGHNYIGTEHILLGLIREGEGVAGKVLEDMGADLGETRRMVLEMLGGAVQGMHKKPNEHGASVKGSKKSVTPALDACARNLNALAEEGKIDPVIGREPEIERVIQILSRRTKNNPVLIGEPGVGKTAIAEGLAQKIVNGAVPEVLLHKRVMSLNIATVVAGAKYRGEFEERLKKIIEEIKTAGDVIIFIDELHTLIGAGAAEGAVDAANILKPALARGELQAIGATTLNEYKKHIEKDAALERRFQPITVSEPSVEDAILILTGIRDKYEAFHRAKITDAAIEAAVKLSYRYISDRFLPDKAIDLMDEAASRAKMQAVVHPEEMKAIEKQLEQLQAEKEAAITAQEFEQAAKLRDAESKLRETFEQQQREWKDKEKIRIVVDADEIAQVVATWTGIPVKKLAQEEAEKLLKMEGILERRVIGQTEAVQAVAKAIRRARAGLKDFKRPIGSFLFLGPTGVGKTELARALAESLFGDESAMLRFDMSEYMEKHTVSRLVGAPPGYVGFEEGGQLTDAVRRKPYSVILLDEIEKAHYDIFNLLLQVLEDGRLTDSQGRTVDFKNTVVIMTSNVGAKHLRQESSAMGFLTAASQQENGEAAKKRVLDEVKRVFRPEFINRVDECIVFKSLTRIELEKIVDILIGEVNCRLKEMAITLQIDAAAKEKVIQEGSDFAYGARPLKRAIQKLIEDEIAELLLKKEIREGDSLCATVQDGKIVFTKKELAVLPEE